MVTGPEADAAIEQRRAEEACAAEAMKNTVFQPVDHHDDPHGGLNSMSTFNH